MLWAINHKLRQQIIQQLHQKGKLSVTEIYIKLSLEQPVASQQSAVLLKAGFVIATHAGKNIYYTVNYERLKEVHELAVALLYANE